MLIYSAAIYKIERLVIKHGFLSLVRQKNRKLKRPRHNGWYQGIKHATNQYQVDYYVKLKF